MPVYENRHLLRVLLSPQEQAQQFIEYCRTHHVFTRGLCRIGTTSRGGMRGLIANKDIEKNDNVVMLSARACLHPGKALRNKRFFDLFPQREKETYLLQRSFIENSRLENGSIIRHNQFFLACYMTYLILCNDINEESQVLKYINFMPRGEGDFEQLTSNMNRLLDNVPLCCLFQSVLASKFHVTQAEIRPVLLWSLSMIFSRMAPIDHRWTLQHAFSDTPFAHAFDFNGQEGDKNFVKEPIAFLCPVIDMCNHSEYENVALMVPEQTNSVNEPVICLRSLRKIQKGEELTMIYGGSPTELRVIWGMREVL